MKTFRRCAVFVVGCVAVCCIAPVVPAGAQPPPVVVSPTEVAPGATLVVSGTGCSASGLVMVGLLDAEEEGLLATGSVGGGGTAGWRYDLTVPASVRPGVYPLKVRCTDYVGSYLGRAGYDGGGGFDYGEVAVTVLPPAEPPTATGPLTVDPTTLPVGGKANVEADGFTAGEQVTVILYSTPTVLAAVKANDSGSISAEVVVPVGTAPGAHTLVAMNASTAVNPVRTLSASVTVTTATTDTPAAPASTDPSSSASTSTTVASAVAGVSNSSGSSTSSGAPLATTGTDPMRLVTLGVLVLLAGVVLLVWVRRRPNHD